MPKKVDFFSLPEKLTQEVGIRVEQRYCTPQTYSQIHRHDYLEIELIMQGGGVQQLNSSLYKLQNGSISILRPADLHGVTLNKPTHYYNISFSEHLLDHALLQSIAAFRGNLYAVLTGEEFSMAGLLCQALLLEAGRPKANKLILHRLLECLMLTVQKRLALTLPPPSEQQEPLQAALTYLQMHFMENPTLQQVAKVAHYNASHFSTCFHREMKQTYSQYLNHLKISYAKNLLITTDLKIDRIGSECGFCSESNFLRVFKQVTGTSPLAYRREAHN